MSDFPLGDLSSFKTAGLLVYLFITPLLKLLYIIFIFIYLRYFVCFSSPLHASLFFISFVLMPNRLLFITVIQFWQEVVTLYLEEHSCVVLHTSEMTPFVYIDRTRCHHWHRIIIQRGQNKQTSGRGLTGEKFNKINSYGGNPFHENDMQTSLFVRLLDTVSYTPSLWACNKLCTLLLWFRVPDFCFLRRFSVQIIGRQCNSRLVRPTGSQSSA